MSHRDLVRNLLLFAFVLISHFSAHAASSCDEVDLRPEFGPVRDQGDSDWCGSFVAADLLSFIAKQRVSAVSVGINYYVGRSSIEAGLLDQAYSSEPGTFAGAFLSTVLSLNAGAELCLADEVPDRLASDQQTEINQTINKMRNENSMHLEYGSPFSCTNPVKIDPEVFRVHGVDWIPRASLDRIHRQLSSRKPVAAIVDNRRLFNLQILPSQVVDIFGDHFVLVIGRKRIAGQCHLLVRNSWGPECMFYGPGVREKCEDGQLWIKESALADTMKNLISVDF